MGIYFHTTLKSTQVFFFFPYFLAAKGKQRPSGTRGGSAADPREPLCAVVSRGHQMTSRAMNVAPNEPVVNRDIRPRCLMLAAPLGRPRPPSGTGKPQGTSQIQGFSSGSFVPPKRAWEKPQPWNSGWKTPPKKGEVAPGRVKGFCSLGLLPPDV